MNGAADTGSVDVVGEVCGLVDSPALTPFIRSTLALFPVATVALAHPLFEALLRVARTVPWLVDALGSAPADPLGELLPILTNQQDGHVGRVEAAQLLAGPYDLAATMVGTEGVPMPGPESLRAALWVCRRRWFPSSHPHLTDTTELASRIRGAVQMRGFRQVARHPVAHLFPDLALAQTLPAFLDAAQPLLKSDSKELRKAWASFDRELRNSVTPRFTPPPQLHESHRHDDAEDEEDAGYESVIRHVRRFSVPRLGNDSAVLEGEPPAETSVPAVMVPLAGPVANKDQRQAAGYRAQQVIWGQNSLLLTCHPDVLGRGPFKEVLAALIDGIHDVEDRELHTGLVGLLLQAVTGRATSALASLVVARRPDTSLRAPLVLSLAEEALRIRLFLAQNGNEPNGYFTPTEEQAEYLESVADAFAVPLPERVMAALGSADGLDRLARKTVEQADALERSAARWVSERVGLPVTVGQIRRSFSAHLFEECRDLVVTQLICADTLGQSDAPAHYYAPRTDVLADAYAALMDRLGLGGAPRFEPTDGRTGSRLLVKLDAAREMAAAVPVPQVAGDRPISRAGTIAIHQAMVRHLACMLLATTGHRPTAALFDLTLEDFDLEGGAALFRDKVHDPAHDPRPVALPSCVTDQVETYLAHLEALALSVPALVGRIHLILSGQGKLLFGLDDNGMPSSLDWSTFAGQLPPAWCRVPRNWGRTWLRTHAVELGLPPELALIELGHFEACGYPFSDASPTEIADFVAATRPYLDKVAHLQGWEVAKGLARTKHASMELPALQSWRERIREHEEQARRVLELQQEAERATQRSYREAALQYVLADPELVAARIPEIYRNPTGPWPSHRITKDVAEAIRDRMLEDAGNNVALRLARASALHGVLHQVNKRVAMQGNEPAQLVSLRRPVDNPLFSGMLLAVRQVNALRRYILDSAKQPPGDWHDFALACARAACAMALFGFCEDPDQIEGALHRRAQRIRPATLDDVVLVPWGYEPHEMLGLRGLAALAIARLARKYPTNEVPPRAQINASLATLLPAWATAASASDSDETTVDWLQLLCEAVAVSNRYELSAGARLALVTKQGSVPAHIQEQAALLDGDAASSVPRLWEQDADAVDPDTSETPRGPRTGNARTQYLSLCRAIPGSGRDLSLPLTGMAIAAGQLEREGTRTLVMAEIDAQLALDTPSQILQPIVRALAVWVLDMLRHGTPLRRQPAFSTVATYLTRIGGALVESFGNGSLGDIGDAELEDAYLAAVESSEKERDAAARAIVQFHACGVQHLGFPELDLSEVRAYLRGDQRDVDTALILPSERAAAAKWLTERSESAIAGAEPGGAGRVRADRQALAAFPLYARTGARRNEVLGLQFKDVYTSEAGECQIRIRANRSRRIKTRAGRRTINVSALALRDEVDQFRTWVDADRQRLLKWRSDTQYIFSPLQSGRLATGRADIADAVMAALRAATGRAHEKIHRLRHLVAFERTTSVFLAPRDRVALANVVPTAPEFASGVALPRDLAGQTVPMGHARPTTTLRCYHHFPWLLRSRADARIAARYMTRRGAAAVMGLTLVATDKITQQRGDTRPPTAWMDHVVARRIVKHASPPLVLTPSGDTAKRWSAAELGKLVELVARGKNLVDALTVFGANVNEAPRLRDEFMLFEQRLGYRILADESAVDSTTPRRVIRDMEEAAGLAAWWEWADDTTMPTRQRDLEGLAVRTWERMAPKDRDRLRVTRADGDTLVRLLVEAQFDEDSIARQPLGRGQELIRVLRPTSPPSAQQHLGPSSVRYIGMSIKRSLGIIWVAFRLRGA